MVEHVGILADARIRGGDQFLFQPLVQGLQARGVARIARKITQLIGVGLDVVELARGPLARRQGEVRRDPRIGLVQHQERLGRSRPDVGESGVVVLLQAVGGRRLARRIAGWPSLGMEVADEEVAVGA
ncbi:hypothetical protein [Caulobacter sp. UC70_42]|uniref:hypothetical protein n=1 Tax=Caulobacter sp. UC70_42 TaxID=3374551 RepID=UPI0037574C9F